MLDFWEQFGINVGLNLLFAVFKNPAKVVALRSALIKLRDALNALPLGDKASPAPSALTEATQKGSFN